MIVRDEEPLVPQFLEHARDLCDQMVVVDTGSTDRTADLFRAAGAEVFSFPWVDDFAAARNESLRHACGDWIVVLDADEFPQPGFAAELRAMMAREDVGAARILRHDEQKNGIVRKPTPLRLFRNEPGIRYRYRIHEDQSESVHAMLARTGRTLEQIRTPVRHVGYLPMSMQSRDKQARDEKLLLLALSDDSDDLYSRYKLLELYRYWERPERAVPVAEECSRLLGRGVAITPAHVAGDLVSMIALALHPSDPQARLRYLHSVEAGAGQCGHYHLALATAFEDMGAVNRAAEHFAQALAVAAGDPAATQIRTRAHMGLARLAMATGQMVAALAQADAAFALSPDDEEVKLARQVLEQFRPSR